MSKHQFIQTVGEVKYEVQIGWDKPCQRYYFVISPFIAKGEFAGELDDPIASNVYLPNPDDLTLEKIRAVCEDCGFTLPYGLLDNVASDKLHDVVNEFKSYNG